MVSKADLKSIRYPLLLGIGRVVGALCSGRSAAAYMVMSCWGFHHLRI